MNNDEQIAKALSELTILETERFKKVFYNHMNDFVRRMKVSEKLDLVLDEEIEKEIFPEIWAEVDEFLEDFCEEVNLDFNSIPREEKFLIATHFQVAERKEKNE